MKFGKGCIMLGNASMEVGQKLSTDDYRQLDAATHAAVKRAGGPALVGSEIFGTSRQVVERYYKHSHTDDEETPRSMPLYRVAELEAQLVSAGHPPLVAVALADRVGYDLVQRPEHVMALSPVAAIGHLMKEAGAACETVTDAMEDGKITPKERKECTADLQKVIAAASKALASLASHND